jgi:hypothetical protein
LLAVGVFLLEVVPLELQRRIVNDLVKHRDYWLVVVICAVYAGVVLVQGGASSRLTGRTLRGKRCGRSKASRSIPVMRGGTGNFSG